MSLWNAQPLPEDVLPPVPPPDSWIGDVVGAAAHVATEGAYSGTRSTDRLANRCDLEWGLPVILLVVDGLGANQISNHLAHAPTLRRLKSEMVIGQTCAPSTTAAALTSLATGKAPGQTRMVGYSVRQGDSVMNLLNFAPGVDAESWQPEPTLFESLALAEIPSSVVTDRRFSGSGLTVAAMRGAKFVGVSGLPERLAAATAQARSGVPLTYVYWAQVDKAGHQYGPNSSEWSRALEDFDAELPAFLKKADGKAQVLLTADHGMVEVTQRIDVAEVPELRAGVAIIAGEGRAAHVHAEPGMAQQVEKRWREYWADQAWIFNRKQIPEVVGSGPGADLIGDLLVMPRGTEVVVDSRTQSAASIAMPGVHGSLTDSEMLIPIWRLV